MHDWFCNQGSPNPKHLNFSLAKKVLYNITLNRVEVRQFIEFDSANFDVAYRNRHIAERH